LSPPPIFFVVLSSERVIGFFVSFKQNSLGISDGFDLRRKDVERGKLNGIFRGFGVVLRML